MPGPFAQSKELKNYAVNTWIQQYFFSPWSLSDHFGIYPGPDLSITFVWPRPRLLLALFFFFPWVHYGKGKVVEVHKKEIHHGPTKGSVLLVELFMWERS